MGLGVLPETRGPGIPEPSQIFTASSLECPQTPSPNPGLESAFSPISNSSVEFSTSFSPSRPSSPRRGCSYRPFQLPSHSEQGPAFCFLPLKSV